MSNTPFLFSIGVGEDCVDNDSDTSADHCTTGFLCVSAEITPTPVQVIHYQYTVQDRSWVPRVERTLLRKVAAYLGFVEGCGNADHREPMISGVSVEPRDRVITMDEGNDGDCDDTGCRFPVQGGMTLYLDSKDYAADEVQDFFWGVLQESLQDMGTQMEIEGGGDDSLVVEDFVLSAPSNGGTDQETSSSSSRTVENGDQVQAQGYSVEEGSSANNNIGNLSPVTNDSSSSSTTTGGNNQASSPIINTSPSTSSSSASSSSSNGAADPVTNGSSAGTSATSSSSTSPSNSAAGPSTNGSSSSSSGMSSTSSSSNSTAGPGTNDSSSSSGTSSASSSSSSAANPGTEGSSSSGTSSSSSSSPISSSGGTDPVTNGSPSSSSSSSSSSGTNPSTSSNPPLLENSVAGRSSSGDTLRDPSGNASATAGNATGAIATEPPVTTNGINQSSSSTAAIWGGTLGGGSMVLLALLVCCCCWRRQRRRHSATTNNRLLRQATSSRSDLWQTLDTSTVVTDLEAHYPFATRDALALQHNDKPVPSTESSGSDDQPDDNNNNNNPQYYDSDAVQRVATVDVDDLLTSDGGFTTDGGCTTDDGGFTTEDEGNHTDEGFHTDEGEYNPYDGGTDESTDGRYPRHRKGSRILQILDETSTGSYDEEIMGVLGHVPSPSADSGDGMVDRSTAESPRSGLQMS